MKYKTLSTLFVALRSIMTLPMRAEQVLAVVWADNEQETYFAVADVPIITVYGNEVSVDDMVDRWPRKTITLSIAELKHFELKDVDLTPVEDVEETNNNVFRMTGSGMEAAGLQKGEMLQVYDTSGRLVQQVRANAQGRVSVTLGRGTYVIKSNNKTFKITKR